MGFYHSPSLVTSGLVLGFDAANPKSYPGSGITWSSLIAGVTGATNANATFETLNLGAMNYDGTDDFTSLAPETLPTGNAMSICIWNYAASSVTGTRGVFWMANALGQRNFAVTLPWNSTVFFDTGAGITGGANVGYNRINKGVTDSDYVNWHHWSFTKNAVSGSMKIYRDGEEWHSGTGMTHIIGIPSTATLGRYGAAGSNWHLGKVSSLLVYNKELSSAEVMQNFNATRGRYGL